MTRMEKRGWWGQSIFGEWGSGLLFLGGELMAMLLWSGGCDSTALLVQMLRREIPVDDPWKLSTIAISHSAVNQRDRERQARREIIAALKARGHNWKHVEVTIRNRSIYPGGCMQAAIWMPTAITSLYDDENLYAGYVRYDDVFHYRHTLLACFQHLSDLCNKTGKLVFPYEWTTKDEVVAILKKHRLLKKCWYCENVPKSGRPCGECGSCKRHLMETRK